MSSCVLSGTNRSAVLGGVVQSDFAARALLGGVYDAGIEGAGIHVQADGTLVELTRIEHSVNGRERIDSTWVGHIHFNDFGGVDCAFAGADVLMHDVKILHLQPADRDGHPAVLV